MMGTQSPLLIVCARELQNSISDSVHRLLNNQIQSIPAFADFYKVYDTYIIGKNGTEFIFKGIKYNPTGMKSAEGADICWVEEAENVSHKSWEILKPTIRKPGSEIWVSFNPKYPEDATCELFLGAPDEDIFVKKVSWRDNPYFTHELNKERLRALARDKKAYDHIWEGEFDMRYFGGVYSQDVVDILQHRTGDVYDPAHPVHTAWDLGYDDATAIWWWQRIGRECRFIDYYENSQQDVPHYAQIIHSKPYTYGKHYVPHDAANKLLAAGGRSIVQQLYSLGVKTYVVAATSQQNQINALREVLKYTWVDTTKCKDGIDYLKKYQFEYDEDKQTFKSSPRHDYTSHAADAAEIIGQVYKELIKEPDKAAPRFLNEMTATELFWPTDPKQQRRERI